MIILEPCCLRKQLDDFLSYGKSEYTHIFTWGDFGLPELLEYFIGISPGCDVFLSLIHMESSTLSSIVNLMERKDNHGTYLIRSLSLFTLGKERAEIVASLNKYQDVGRMFICESRISFRCLTVSDGERHFVLSGSINQSPVYSMQMLSLSTSEQEYKEIMRVFGYQHKKQLKKRNQCP